MKTGKERAFSVKWVTVLCAFSRCYLVSKLFTTAHRHKRKNKSEKKDNIGEETKDATFITFSSAILRKQFYETL